MVLTQRERLLIGALAALLAVLAVLGALRGLAGFQRGLAEEVDGARHQFAQALALDLELTQIERAKNAKGLEGSLIGYMEQLADRAGLKARVQLNPIGQAGAARVQAIDVKADQVTLDELLRLMYTIENAEYILVVDQVEISPSFKEKDLLRVSLRVLARA